MKEKYLIDTCIWIDLYEDRKGFNNGPLGDYALKLFLKIKNKGDAIIVTDLLIMELEMNYSIPEINSMLRPFQNLIEKLLTTHTERIEAKHIGLIRNIPSGDVLHAIIARNHHLILITRDRHFQKLKDISKVYKPEEII